MEDDFCGKKFGSLLSSLCKKTKALSIIRMFSLLRKVRTFSAVVELTLNDQELVGLTPLGFSSQISGANALQIKLGTTPSCIGTENQLSCSSN